MDCRCSLEPPQEYQKSLFLSQNKKIKAYPTFPLYLWGFQGILYVDLLAWYHGFLTLSCFIPWCYMYFLTSFSPLWESALVWSSFSVWLEVSFLLVLLIRYDLWLDHFPSFFSSYFFPTAKGNHKSILMQRSIDIVNALNKPFESSFNACLWSSYAFTLEKHFWTSRPLKTTYSCAQNNS